MKKFLIYFSFLLLHSSFCFAQDTLVLKNGQKMNVTIISVTDKIRYTIPKGDNMSIRFSKVEYIKYKDGSTYNIKTNSDTTKMNWKPYIVVGGGICMPLFNYAANQNTTDVSATGFQGYANTGPATSVTIGFKRGNGWDLMGTFSYGRNAFNAEGIVNESLYSFINGNNFTTINTVGNYYYSNYSFLVGFSKNAKYKYGEIGFIFMLGDIITQVPAINGIVTNYYTSNSFTGYYGSILSNPGYSYNMNIGNLNNFVLDIGFHGDVKLSKYFFIRISSEFELTEMLMNGTYQITDPKTGTVIQSGAYTGNESYPSTMFKGLWNITAGIGYKL